MEKQVYAIKAPHTLERQQIGNPEVVNVQLDILELIATHHGDISLFREGLSRDGRDGMEDVMRRLSKEGIASRADYAKSQGNEVQWQQGLTMASILNLREEGTVVRLQPTEEDSSSTEMVNALMQGLPPTERIFELMMQYMREKGLTPDRMITVADTLPFDLRCHFGDREMARCISQYGSDNNILLVGRRHPLEDWGSKFSLRTITIDDAGNGEVEIKGIVPPELLGAIHDYIGLNKLVSGEVEIS